MEWQAMMASVPRATVTAFFEALGSRDPLRIEPFLADDIHWTVTGPTDLLEFCGTWQGRQSVMSLFRDIVSDIFDNRMQTHEAVLVDGNQAAALSRFSARQRSTGRVICYRLAHFARFHEHKVSEFRTLNDSLDAAEQLLGYPLDLSRHDPSRPIRLEDGIVI